MVLFLLVIEWLNIKLTTYTTIYKNEEDLRGTKYLVVIPPANKPIGKVVTIISEVNPVVVLSQTKKGTGKVTTKNKGSVAHALKETLKQSNSTRMA